MVEYAGETEDEVKEQVYKLEELRKKERIGYAASLAFKPEEVKAIWGGKKSRTRIAARDQGRQEADRVRRGHRYRAREASEFIKRFREIIWPRCHCRLCGYCSVGCMHIRPLINLNPLK